MKAYMNKVQYTCEVRKERERGILSGACTLLAVVVYVLYKRKWHKENINKLIDDVIAVLDMPPIFGKSLENDEVIEELKQKGMDVMRIADHIQIAWD